MLQLSIGAVFTPLVGLAGTASAVPMALAMAAFGLAALAMVLVVSRQELDTL